MFYIDFETRSCCDLSKAGARKYSKDTSTDVMCCGLLNSESNQAFVLTPKDFSSYKPSTDEIYVAHNAEFDFNVWINQMTPKYDWPSISLNKWRCTAAKSAALGLPRALGDVAKLLKLGAQKDQTGATLMRRLSKPRSSWIKTGEGPKWFEEPNELYQLYKYCMDDVYVVQAIDLALPNLQESEQLLWELTCKLNERGIYVDALLATTCLSLVQVFKKDVNQEVQDLTNGVISTINQVGKIAKWCELPNLSIDEVNKTLNSDSSLDQKKRKLLTIRRSHRRSSVSKYKALLDRKDEDGRIRDCLVYYGTYTGRWSSYGPQVLNLFRPAYKTELIEQFGIDYLLTKNTSAIKLIFSDPMTLLASTIRSTLCASPGHDLIGADYSTIETCILFWIVEEEKALTLLKQNKDLYVDMAADIYGIPVSQVSKDAHRPLGKEAVLGLGFRLGPKTLLTRCHKKGIKITKNLAEDTVCIYRAKYPNVVQYWHRLERLALEAMSGRNNAKFRRVKNFLQMRLVSGRYLSYYLPEVRIGKFNKPVITYVSKNRRIEIHGGVFTGNDVQATARDLMAHGLLNAEENGYPIILPVHDEAVAEVPEGFGSINGFIKLLCSKPEWAKGCVIRAEGWRGKRYRK